MSHATESVESTPSFISPSLPQNFMAENPPVDARIKLGVMASGSGSNFEVIAEAIASGKLNAEITVLIYNNPEAKVVERANRYGIPGILLNHRYYKSRQYLDAKIVETFREYDVEMVVMAGWMRIVTEVLLNAFPDKVINLHPSLLPSFRGAHAVEDALKAGVKITGCTVHITRLEVDNGPILIQAAVPILPDDTPKTLHDRIQVQEHQIFPQAIAIAAAQLREK